MQMLEICYRYDSIISIAMFVSGEGYSTFSIIIPFGLIKNIVCTDQNNLGVKILYMLAVQIV